MTASFPGLTQRTTIDTVGSTDDKIFAQAVLISRPEPVMIKYGLAKMYEVPEQVNSVDVPVFTNFDLTWTDVSGTGSDLGSEISATAASAATYRTLTPVMRTAALAVAEQVDYHTNRSSFEELATRAGGAVSGEIDRIGITDGVFSSRVTQIYAAGGFNSNGSATSGSTLGPEDLTDAKALLRAGSVNVYKADVALMHPHQYTQLVKHSDFTTSNYPVFNKAKFENGDLVEYDGMKIVLSERIASQATGGYFTAAGRKVAVFDSKVAVAMAEKTAAMKVRRQFFLLNHVNVIVFDIMVAADCLVPAAVVHLHAAN